MDFVPAHPAIPVPTCGGFLNLFLNDFQKVSVFDVFYEKNCISPCKTYEKYVLETEISIKTQLKSILETPVYHFLRILHIKPDFLVQKKHS
jgi:hypothetical protein